MRRGQSAHLRALRTVLGCTAAVLGVVVTMYLRCLLLAGVLVSLCGCSQVSGFASTPRMPTSTSSSNSYRSTASVSNRHAWRVGTRRRPEARRETAHMMSRGRSFRPSGESKRQARVSQLMTSELAEILRLGHGIKTKDKIADDVRCKISVVDVDMSPDLRSAKVFVSVYGDVLEKREAYAWCVKNTKAIRMALANKLKDMKRVPELYFKDTDIGAAVDLMALIDKVGAEDDAAAAARGGNIDGAEGLSEDDMYTFDFDEGDDDDEVEGFEGLSEEDFFAFALDDDDDDDEEDDDE